MDSFPDTHVSSNPEMKKRGISCAQQTDTDVIPRKASRDVLHAAAKIEISVRFDSYFPVSEIFFFRSSDIQDLKFPLSSENTK